jgi:hypothetical protein
VERALHDLGTADFGNREKALADLQSALARQLLALLSTRDPEVESRLRQLLEFQAGITRWALDLLALPPEKRAAAVAFGLRPEMVRIMPKLFSDAAAERLAGVKDLRDRPGDEATDLLAKFVDDPDRAVYVAAMEGLWDRRPTAAAIDALWFRAVDAGLAVYRPQATAAGEPILFRGRAVGAGTVSDTSALYRRAQDGALACDVLAHLQAPEVLGKLVRLLDEVDAAAANPAGRTIAIYSSTQEPMKNVARLLEVYKPPAVAPVLYRIATGRVAQRSQGQVNAIRYYSTNRTWAIAALLQLTGQKPEDAKLARQPLLNGMWATTGEADEEAAVAALKKWWAAHGGEFAGKKQR